MLEGKVEEHPERRAEAFVMAPLERGAGDLARLGVRGEGARRAAEDVARELVEADRQGEALGRGLDEPVERPAGRPLVDIGVALGDFGIEFGRRTKPDLPPLDVGGEVGGLEPGMSECLPRPGA